MIELIPLIILALAAWRITRFLIEDHLFEPLRDRIWSKFPPESTKIGYFFSCPWCMGFWVSAVVVVLYTLVPVVALPVFTVFALSAIVGLIDTKLN
jgi:hypothetical protein